MTNEKTLQEYNTRLRENNSNLNTILTMINSLSGEGGEEMINYSTEEQIIGTWVDGKLLYRKVYEMTTIPTTNTDLIDIIDLNIDNLIKFWGTAKTSTGHIYPIPLTDSSSNYNVMFIRALESIRGRATLGSGGKFTNVIIVLEYTKTTD